jgi:hypothetical protein
VGVVHGAEDEFLTGEGRVHISEESFQVMLAG